MHTSTKWLMAELAIIGLVVVALGAAGFPLFLPYEWHKLLHIFGAVIFLGNIIVTGVWIFMAERSHDRLIVHFAAKAVNWADVIFTAPGVLLVLANGLIMMAVWGGVNTSWIAISLGVFALSGLIWVVLLLKYQDRLIQFSSEAAEPDRGPPQIFYKTLHRWYFWGIVATVLPLSSLILMVLKPTF
jgi:uncharacterized membrane protein